jgi:hypothetical protein
VRARRLAIVLVLVVGLGSQPRFAAGSVPAADPLTFNIGGVRLLMTPSEAHAAMLNDLPPGRRDNIGGPSVLCVDDRIAAIRESDTQAPPARCQSSMGFDNGSKTIVAAFIEDYPEHPGVMRVFAVSYTESGHSGLQAERDAWKAELSSLYGPWRAAGDRSADWGAVLSWNPARYPIGTDSNGTLMASLPGASSELHAEMGNNLFHLVMTDAPFAMERDAAIRAAYRSVIPIPGSH